MNFRKLRNQPRQLEKADDDFESIKKKKTTHTKKTTLKDLEERIEKNKLELSNLMTEVNKLKNSGLNEEGNNSNNLEEEEVEFHEICPKIKKNRIQIFNKLNEAGLLDRNVSVESLFEVKFSSKKFLKFLEDNWLDFFNLKERVLRCNSNDTRQALLLNLFIKHDNLCGIPWSLTPTWLFLMQIPLVRLVFRKLTAKVLAKFSDFLDESSFKTLLLKIVESGNFNGNEFELFFQLFDEYGSKTDRKWWVKRRTKRENINRNKRPRRRGRKKNN